MPSKSAIYVRISSDPRGLRAGIERQEEDCRALAASKGWGISEVYVDNDVS
ncbi:MAG: recombinase family protein [Actinobacteria bacterium]|nr:recombinase family protein [Actinomycetota bacterium]